MPGCHRLLCLSARNASMQTFATCSTVANNNLSCKIRCLTAMLSLITFFRRADQTSTTIGKRQAATFKIFAALSGFGDLPSAKNTKGKTIAAPSSTATRAVIFRKR